MVSDALSRSDDDPEPTEDEAALEGTSHLERAARMPGYPAEDTEEHDLPGSVVREPRDPSAPPDDSNADDESGLVPGARQLSDDERSSQQQATFD